MRNRQYGGRRIHGPGIRGYCTDVTRHIRRANLKLMRAIRKVLAGQLWLSESMHTQLVHRHLHGTSAPKATSELDNLSDRELEVFQMIGNGLTTRRIATKLHLSVSTVETYRAHLKEKLRLANGMELVRRAVEWVNRQQK